MRALLAAILLAAGLAWPVAARAQDNVLTVTVGPRERTFTVANLLRRTDAATINIPVDVAYGAPMTYRAVPLHQLLGLSEGAAFDTIEARAADGFASQIPLELITQGASGGAVPWIAVEDPRRPWPALPGKTVSAGPFYLVWEHPERSSVGNEMWPFQLASLRAVANPARRWPQLVVDASLPEDSPARRGQGVFITQCIACHRMKGAGASDMGPDLGEPMSPTRYMTPDGLRALIRDPKAVRTWPQQQMPGFSAAALPDDDLEALIAYLEYMASAPQAEGD
jgi:mono/diheme cytochrome c family protein